MYNITKRILHLPQAILPRCHDDWCALIGEHHYELFPIPNRIQ